ncbi:NAD-dependent epimerase/dehydratase family protein [Chitinimonas lacunae]|uniref:NAD-dependent epimerase/dehydratase family protein n=1 Tax=Chitinimonas lacunae TaxID=1963018 RepID=A0ABV8MP74_9NEIS
MECILITGGAGFIGSHSAERLLAAGQAVRVFDDFSSGRRANLPSHPQLEIVTGDIRDLAAVERSMAGCSRVLHLAAQVSVRASVEAPCDSASRNLTGFLNVLDAARRLGIGRLVYASSAAVYGQPRDLPLDEQSPVQPVSPYGLEKLINDQYAALFGSLYGLSCLGLRYFNVYGPRQDPHSPYAGVLSKFTDRLRQGQGLTVFGDGEQTRDFIYVKDVAEFNHRALFSEHSGVLNVATGHSRSLNSVITVLGSILGRAPEVTLAPRPEGDIVHSASRNDALTAALGTHDFVALEQGLRRLLEAGAS